MANEEDKPLTDEEIERIVAQQKHASEEAKKIIAKRLRSGEIKLDKKGKLDIQAGYQMEELDFWDGVTIGGKKLSEFPEEEIPKIKKEIMKVINAKLITSDELAKIHFNTQVYNSIQVSEGVETTTRGGHSEGVARVAKVLAQTYRQRMKGKERSEEEAEIAGLFSESLGYMHDFGHTPFGHDGEGALDAEMSRFYSDEMMEEYRESRRELFGEEYAVLAGDAGAKTMCYEHNETSAIIAAQTIKGMLGDVSKLLADRGLIEEGAEIDFSDKSMQYIVTGILAHSTSRVVPTPRGIEQQAVRLADKVAYVPQDLLDLLKKGIIKISDLDNDQRKLLRLDTELTDQQIVDGIEPHTGDEEKDAEESERASLIGMLYRLEDLSDAEKETLFDKLDDRVAEAQVEIAERCVDKDNPEFVAMKEVVDAIDREYKAHEDLDDPKNAAYKDTPEVEVYRKLREEQEKLKDIKDPKEYEAQLQRVKEASRAFSKKLQESYGMDPLLATLWSTKATFQDSFIRGELARVTDDGRDTLASINDREGHAWQMKAVFQFFYTHPEMIPPEFAAKYPEGEFTAPQVISAYVASFTNDGLTSLFEKLNKSGQVISREQAIDAIEAADPNFDIKSFVKKDSKLPDGTKISANDKLEVMFTQLTGRAITEGGTVEMPPHRFASNIQELSRRTRYRKDRDKIVEGVPESELETKLDMVTSEPKKKSERAEEILAGVIKRSRGEITAEDIQQITNAQREQQDKHKAAAEEKAAAYLEEEK